MCALSTAHAILTTVPRLRMRKAINIINIITPYLARGYFKVYAVTQICCFSCPLLCDRLMRTPGFAAYGREMYVASARIFISNVPLWLEQRWDSCCLACHVRNSMRLDRRFMSCLKHPRDADRVSSDIIINLPDESKLNQQCVVCVQLW